eukprot:1160146-Pelagomonas_calceolata.AAC.8
MSQPGTMNMTHAHPRTHLPPAFAVWRTGHQKGLEWSSSCGKPKGAWAGWRPAQHAHSNRHQRDRRRGRQQASCWLAEKNALLCAYVPPQELATFI